MLQIWLAHPTPASGGDARWRRHAERDVKSSLWTERRSRGASLWTVQTAPQAVTDGNAGGDVRQCYVIGRADAASSLCVHQKVVHSGVALDRSAIESGAALNRACGSFAGAADGRADTGGDGEVGEHADEDGAETRGQGEGEHVPDG